jgi:CHAP domain-containing protein
MTLEATLAHVSALRQALADPAALIGTNGSLTGGAEAPTTSVQPGGSEAPGTTGTATSGSEASFASTLAQASATNGVLPTQAAAAGSPGARIVQVAESQLGQSEQPPGSNESPAIAEYRGATAGAVPGAPWCAYFASWVARQAGEPIGEGGQGAGAVADVWSWAQNSGRAIANGPGVVPKPGDLIVFGDEHVGIVRDVLPNGQIQTIEGNYENKVAANVRSPTEATGYVEMS